MWGEKMDIDQLQLTENDIYEKDFKTSFRGYNQKEVDGYLDTIIKDYGMFRQEIERLTQENERLKQQSDETHTRTSPPNHQVNYDILKRLSSLEKAVFGKKTADADQE